MTDGEMGDGARVLAVNVVHEVIPDPGGRVGVTAIDKRPVTGRVAVRALGLEGDRVMDERDHGGLDQAVYVFAREDASWWEQELGRDIPPGLFGENITTVGLDVTGARIGERWQVGSAVLEVVKPRIPCSTFQRRMGEPRWVKRFMLNGAPGAYCRVIQEGEVGVGDVIATILRPPTGITIGEAIAKRGSAANRDAAE
jgi:MOSC domain-containing protein YiiM